MLLYHISIFVIANHLFLAGLLFLNPKVSNIHNRFLAGQLACIAYFHFILLLINWEQNHIYKYLTGSEYIFGALIGPLIYLYVYSYVKEPFLKKWELYRHFLVAGVFTIIFVLIQLNSRLLAGISDVDSVTFAIYAYTGDSICWLMIIPYILSAYLIFRRAKRKNRNKPQLKWLHTYFTATFIVLVIGLPMSFIKNGREMGMYIPLVTLVYYCVLFWQSMSTSKLFTQDNQKIIPELNDFGAILSFFDNNKPYKNQDLTLESLAEQMDMPKNQLSHAINTQLGMNFFELVNSYRIKEAKYLMLDADFGHFTIDAIAKEAGFKSRTSFYEAFKKQTGQTPTEFRLNNIANKN